MKRKTISFSIILQLNDLSLEMRVFKIIQLRFGQFDLRDRNKINIIYASLLPFVFVSVTRKFLIQRLISKLCLQDNMVTYLNGGLLAQLGQILRRRPTGPFILIKRDQLILISYCNKDVCQVVLNKELEILFLFKKCQQFIF